jgi:hypothetical protein
MTRRRIVLDGAHETRKLAGNAPRKVWRFAALIFLSELKSLCGNYKIGPSAAEQFAEQGTRGLCSGGLQTAIGGSRSADGALKCAATKSKPRLRSFGGVERRATRLC